MTQKNAATESLNAETHDFQVLALAANAVNARLAAKGRNRWGTAEVQAMLMIARTLRTISDDFAEKTEAEMMTVDQASDKIHEGIERAMEVIG